MDLKTSLCTIFVMLIIVGAPEGKLCTRSNWGAFFNSKQGVSVNQAPPTFLNEH